MLKETIKSTKLPVLWLCIMVLLLNANYTDAQDFKNEGGGTYSVGNVSNTAKRGVIRMKGTSTGTTNNGSITGIGESAATRIPGTVIWAKTSTDGSISQDVQTGYYTNLGVQNIGKKIFGAENSTSHTTDVKAYYVSGQFLRFKSTTDAAVGTKAIPYGTYEISTFAAATYPNIVHGCNSDFYYDGTGNQEILGSFETSTEPGDNIYASLTKTGGGSAFIYTPTITWAWTNNAGGATNIIAFPGGIGKLDMAATATACDNIPPSEDDSIIVNPPNPPDPPRPPEDTTKPPTDPPSDPCAVALAEGKTLTIDGTIYLLDAAGNPIVDADGSPLCLEPGQADQNCVPDPAHKPSRVVYASTATTIAPAKYGILEVDNGAALGVGGEVMILGKVANALTVVGDATINTNYPTSDGAGTINGEGYNRITFADYCADAVYTTGKTDDFTPSDATGCGEVLGWIYRESYNNSVASQVAKMYTYHNNATKLAFGVLPQSAGQGTESFGMLMLNSKYKPATSYAQVGTGLPSKAEIPADPTTIGYIDRLWEVNYAGNTGTISGISLGFVESEIAKTQFGWDDADPEAWKKAVRGYEAYADASNGDANTLTTLSGDLNTAAQNWLFSDAAACGYYTASQNTGSIIYLNGSVKDNGAPAPGDASRDVAAFDIAGSSQFVFGNQPLFFASTRNGRWSDPGTWDKKSTPTARDNVDIKHLVYTGYYNAATAETDASFLGNRQWSTNEYDLPGVKSVNGFAVLADSVTIKAANPTGTGLAKTGQWVALIIGNEDDPGTKTYPTGSNSTNEPAVGGGTAMNPETPLLFRILKNEAISPNEASWSGNRTRESLQTHWGNGTSPSFNINGLWITSATNSGTYRDAVINPKTVINSGTLVNEGIMEVGHDE